MSTIETFDEYNIDLHDNYVNIEINTYAMINKVKQKVGNTRRVAYSNCPDGRERVQSLLPEEYVNAVFAVWGSEPTLENPTMSNNTVESSNEEGVV